MSLTEHPTSVSRTPPNLARSSIIDPSWAPTITPTPLTHRVAIEASLSPADVAATLFHEAGRVILHAEEPAGEAIGATANRRINQDGSIPRFGSHGLDLQHHPIPRRLLILHINGELASPGLHVNGQIGARGSNGIRRHRPISVITVLHRVALRTFEPAGV